MKNSAPSSKIYHFTLSFWENFTYNYVTIMVIELLVWPVSFGRLQSSMNWSILSIIKLISVKFLQYFFLVVKVNS